MKWLYLGAGVALLIKILVLPYTVVDAPSIDAVQAIVQDSGVTNAVSGIIFRNRVYDTIFEVVVFSIAILGAKFLLSNEKPFQKVYQLTDRPSIILARLGATLSALVSIELGIRGHLSPGGGFAAGVAGGTAIGLITLTVSPEEMQELYHKWQAATWEKLSVLLFIVLAVLTLIGLELPHGEAGELISGGFLPILNILVAVKVALGSWAAILIFIRYRGLL
ncbi:MAG: Na(+)/H(+) antiporter subunit B [Microcystaceae cyanobacterium]